MFLCPDCREPLNKHKGSFGVLWVCPSCNGRTATVSQLRRSVDRETVNRLWRTVVDFEYPRTRSCPACTRPMEEVPVPGVGGDVHVDVCKLCQFIWFDPSEYERLPAAAEVQSDGGDTLPLEARVKLAEVELTAIRERARGAEWGNEGPESWWQLGLAVLGMPVELDASAVTRAPLVTWILTLIVTIVSVIAFSDLDQWIGVFGLIPAKAFRYGGLTFLTSFFLHGGFFHLLGNMYFLLVLGDNVEDVLGRRRFGLLLLAATLAGGIAHVLGASGSVTPCVGASGGISGIIAFYALQFPHARMGMVMRLYLYFRWIRIPAYGMFAMWIILQMFGVWMQLAGFSNVSALAHLGGVSVGVAFWAFSRVAGIGRHPKRNGPVI